MGAYCRLRSSRRGTGPVAMNAKPMPATTFVPTRASDGTDARAGTRYLRDGGRAGSRRRSRR